MTGDEIRGLRKRLGESYAKFGQRFGVTRQTIYQWEQRGTPVGLQRHYIEQVVGKINQKLVRDSYLTVNKKGGG
jgi:DNA-binding transcriptional regulator YiaG